MKRFNALTRRLALVLLVAAGVGAGALATTQSSTGGLAVAAATSQSGATMNLTSASATPGETATIRLRTTAGDVAGYQANVTFDPDVVRVESVSGVDMDDPVTNVQNDSGWVFLTQSAASGSDATVLAEITFRVREDAALGDSSALALVESDTLVNDGDGNEIPVTLRDGRIEVAESGSDPGNGGIGDSGLFGNPVVLVVAGGAGVATAVGLGVVVGLKFA